MREDADIIFSYLTAHVGLRDSDIILFGRSMGSGPASYLASKKNAFTLLLMSPYTSIQDVSRSLLGKLSFFLTPFVIERFRNIDAIKETKCPLFLLHGALDTLIPPSHSQELLNNCPTVSFFQLAKLMDHNEFDFIGDLVQPFRDFINRISSELPDNLQTRRQHKEKEGYVTVYSDIDDSCIDYHKDSNLFEVFFDSKLFKPPESILAMERKSKEERKRR